MSVYAGRMEDDTITLLAINKRGGAVEANILLQGITFTTGGLADVVTAPALGALTATINGVADPADDLSDAPSLPVAASQANTLSYTFEPISITLLRLQVQP